MQQARAARRVGPQPADVPGRREGHRRPRRVGAGAERAGAEHPVVPRRLGGPGAVEQDDAHVRRRRRLRARRRPGGRNLHFGIREHAMAAAVNGMALSKLRPFGATFFIFSDYARGAIRLSALMELPTLMVFTHDAMGDGEDGPTHQPIEQLASLRAMPGMTVLRPGDANEVTEAYRYVLQQKHRPAIIVLSRQPLPTLDRSRYAPAAGVAQGAYVLADAPGGDARGDPDRDGQRGEPRGGRARSAGRATASARASCRCRRGTSSSSSRRRIATACCRRPSPRASRSSRRRRSAGSATSATRGAAIGMHTFGASAPLEGAAAGVRLRPANVVAVAKGVLRAARRGSAPAIARPAAGARLDRRVVRTPRAATAACAASVTHPQGVSGHAAASPIATPPFHRSLAIAGLAVLAGRCAAGTAWPPPSCRNPTRRQRRSATTRTRRSARAHATEGRLLRLQLFAAKAGAADGACSCSRATWSRPGPVHRLGQN